MINKIVRKSMNKKKGLLASIIVLLVISSLLVGQSHFVYDTMGKNYQQMKTEANVEDFRIYTLPVDADQFAEIYADDVLAEFEAEFDVRLEVEETASIKADEGRSFTIVKYDEDAQIDKLILEDGSFPDAENEIMIQTQAAEQSNLKIGDKLDIGGEDYTVSGIGYIVEYITPIDMMSGIITPNFEKYMPVIMSESGFDNLDEDIENLSFSTLYKGKFATYEKDFLKRQDLYEQMIEYNPLEVPVLDDYGMPQISATGEMVTEEMNRFMYVMDLDFNMPISSVENEVKSSQTMFTFLSLVLSVITIFLATILVNSVFKSQRREMGIMKAEGVSIPKLGFGFAFYMLVVIIIGFTVGALLSTVTAEMMRGIYAETFMLKDYLITNDTVKLVVIQLAKVGVVMILAIYFLSIRKNLNTPTLHLVKNINSEKAPKHNVGKMFKRLSFVRKYQFNLLLRNFSKTVLLTFAVVVSSLLLLLGALMYDSVHNMMDNIFGTTFNYEYVVQYSQNNIINEGDVDNGFISTEAKIVSVPRADELEEPLTGEETVTFEAYDFDNNSTVNLTNVDGEKIDNNYDGVIASSGFLKNYNLKIGDKITVENPFKADAEVELEIVEETSDYFLPYVYMPLDLFQSTFNIRDNMINAYYSTDKLTETEKDKIMDKDAGAIVFEMMDMEEMMGDNMYILNLTIIIIAILAAIIAFVALYSISSVIIESNSKTISVMKVLGYSSKEVRTMTIGIYKWLVIGIYVISIPGLEKTIQTIVKVAMADADFAIPINLNYSLSLMGLGVILVVYLIASSLTYRKIEHIKLSESLKADE